jgi:hypothetical protein
MFSSFSFNFYCANRANVLFKHNGVIIYSLVSAIPTDAKDLRKKGVKESLVDD